MDVQINMKIVFLINSAHFLSEFFGKLSDEAIKRQDECIVVFSSKIAEYEKRKFFPEGVRFISAIDWCVENYQEDKKEFFGLSWKFFFPFFDRSGFLGLTHDRSLKITQQAIQFFEFIFEKEKPAIIISEPPSGMFHQVAHHFCKKNNASYIGLGASRFAGRIDVFNGDQSFLRFKKTFEEIGEHSITFKEKEFAKNFIRDFISHKAMPSYMASAKVYFSRMGLVWHFSRRVKEVWAPFLRYMASRQQYKPFDYESEIARKRYGRALFVAERKKIRTFFQKKFFGNYGGGREYFLYPLHYQPEASTSVYATYYCDQINTIKNIAFALPFPYRLYVKEHPVAVGTRQSGFYKKLAEIPNVVLISASENTQELIENSSGVITLTSTVGMEAVLAGKPAYILGNVFYAYHPLCRQVSGFDDLKERIGNDMINVPKLDNLEDNNIRFVISYLKNTIFGNLLFAGKGKDTNDYRLIYEELLTLLGRSHETK